MCLAYFQERSILPRFSFPKQFFRAQHATRQIERRMVMKILFLIKHLCIYIFYGAFKGYCGMPIENQKQIRWRRRYCMQILNVVQVGWPIIIGVAEINFSIHSFSEIIEKYLCSYNKNLSTVSHHLKA